MAAVVLIACMLLLIVLVQVCRTVFQRCVRQWYSSYPALPYQNTDPLFSAEDSGEVGIVLVQMRTPKFGRPKRSFFVDRRECPLIEGSPDDIVRYKVTTNTRSGEWLIDRPVDAPVADEIVDAVHAFLSQACREFDEDMGAARP